MGYLTAAFEVADIFDDADTIPFVCRFFIRVTEMWLDLVSAMAVQIYFDKSIGNVLLCFLH